MSHEKPILNAYATLGPVLDLSSTTVQVTFNFIFDDDAKEHSVGAIFKAFDDVFALTITPHSAKIINSNGVPYIDASITLSMNEEYRVDFGVKKYLFHEEFKLYIRICKEQEQHP